jgi:LysM repeat protein
MKVFTKPFILSITPLLLITFFLVFPLFLKAQTSASLALSGNWFVKIDDKIDGNMTSVAFSDCEITLSQIDESSFKGELKDCGNKTTFEGQIMNDELIVVLATHDDLVTLFTGRKLNDNTIRGVYYTEKNAKEGEFLWQRVAHTGLAASPVKAQERTKGGKATHTASGETTQMKQANVVHIVKQGDTIYSIARTYNLTMQQLLDLNNRTSMDIKIGDQVRVIP